MFSIARSLSTIIATPHKVSFRHNRQCPTTRRFLLRSETPRAHLRLDFKQPQSVKGAVHPDGATGGSERTLAESEPACALRRGSAGAVAADHRRALPDPRAGPRGRS